jgi:hypothetical protein
MAMVCPQCNTTHEQRLQCPLCGTRLLYHDLRRLRARSGGPLRWQQTPWGRILIGLVLSQGLFYGLRHLLAAALLAAWGEEAVQQLWGSASGFFLVQGVRIAALLLGAVLAGGGQRHGLTLGAVVGAWNGVLSVLFLPGPAQALTTVAVFGQPLLQAVCGAAGGWLGSSIWKPVPVAEVHAPPPVRKRGAWRSNLAQFKGPVAYFRVAAGVALAVAGTLSATLLFEKILDLSHGALATSDELQDRLITLEIKALALLLGGVLAGASTANGGKQGLCVGLATSVILIGIEMNFLERWLQIAGLTVVGAFSLSLVGGWFGSQLFPPVVKRRARGLGPAAL